MKFAIGKRRSLRNPLLVIVLAFAAAGLPLTAGAANDYCETHSGAAPAMVGNNSFACGPGSVTGGNDASAVGYNAKAAGNQSSAYGSGSFSGNQSVAFGAGAWAGHQASAIGESSYASLGGSAFGYQAYADGNQSLAVGQEASVTAKFGTAIGSVYKDANGNDHATKSSAVGATALGAGAQAAGVNSIAVGTMAYAKGEGAIANGYQAQALADSSVALGAKAKVNATATNAVALGAGSIASEANTVSVGSVGHERRIVNVADGINATDAVNVSQLNSAKQQAKTYADQGDAAILSSANAHADQGDTATLSSANAHADKGDKATLSSANAHADQGDKATLTRANAYTDKKFANIPSLGDLNAFKADVGRRFQSVNKRIDQVGAMGAAMAQMAFSVQGINTPNRIGVGVANYHGANAVAVGYSRSVTESLNLTIGAAHSGDGTQVAVGAGFGW